MSRQGQHTGRVRQKMRTEQTLIRAARALLKDGRMPTVAEVAEAANVSKATAYRYFGSQEEMLLEASDATLAPPPVDFGEGLDVPDRVAAAAEHFLGFIRANERFVRTRMRSSLDRWLNGQDPAQIRRTYRLPWIRAALEPARATLHDEAYDRLSRALLMVCSPEAITVLTDVMGLPWDHAAETVRWSMVTMTRAVLAPTPITADSRDPTLSDANRR